MTSHQLHLDVLPGRYAICRLPASAPLPDWISGAFFSITRTQTELSLVCAEPAVPAAVRRETGWRLVQVAGPLDLALVGVLASLVAPLAEAGVSVFALSTFDTDYLLVRDSDLETAAVALARHGHRVTSGPPCTGPSEPRDGIP